MDEKTKAEIRAACKHRNAGFVEHVDGRIHYEVDGGMLKRHAPSEYVDAKKPTGEYFAYCVDCGEEWRGPIDDAPAWVRDLHDQLKLTGMYGKGPFKQRKD